MEKSSPLWSFPADGKAPDLSNILQARDLETLFDRSADAQEAALAEIEAEHDRAVARARAAAADLKTKGIHMDVDRLMRGSLLDRMTDKWHDWVDAWRERGVPQDAPPPNHALFIFNLPLARTYPTDEIAMDYDAIDAEVKVLIDALTRQITASRGAAPQTLSVPSDLIDELAEQEDWTEAEDVLLQAESIVAYWPPNGAPALALYVAQEDGGLNIEVTLMGHGAVAHRRFVDLCADHGVVLG